MLFPIRSLVEPEAHTESSAAPRGPMTGRERIMAVLEGKPVDRIPFVPLIGPYTLMDMSLDLKEGGSMGPFDPLRMLEANRLLKTDPMIRHVPVTTGEKKTIHLEMLGSFVSPIETRSGFEGGALVETISTPRGDLTGHWKFSDRAGVIPHLTKFAVNTYEEMKIFHYAVDRLDASPVAVNPDPFLEVEEAMGEDGIATSSFSNTPLMYLIEMSWGLENTYYLLNDHREEVEDILKKLHASLKRHVAALATGPAEVIIQYENTSSTLLSPAVFRRYCLPFINEYADILKSAGKIYLMHMCGKLRSFTDEFAEGKFSGIVDIAPDPTGDLPLDMAAERIRGKVLIGGIDPTTFINPNADTVETIITDLIKKIKPHRGVMLGSADVTPRGARIENFKIIRELVDTLGAYG